MEIQIWELVVIILIVLLLGGMLAFIFVSLVPLINQLKRTAQQLEITASSLDKVINNELKGSFSTFQGHNRLFFYDGFLYIVGVSLR